MKMKYNPATIIPIPYIHCWSNTQLIDDYCEYHCPDMDNWIEYEETAVAS